MLRDIIMNRFSMVTCARGHSALLFFFNISKSQKKNILFKCLINVQSNSDDRQIDLSQNWFRSGYKNFLLLITGDQSCPARVRRACKLRNLLEDEARVDARV